MSTEAMLTAVVYAALIAIGAVLHYCAESIGMWHHHKHKATRHSAAERRIP
ncbi:MULTISPECIES: hypothetical protein [unclassified Mycobacterium]|uniref:hypothetical protein n=1 Tax=unclassified Mycobacterium TaxID=2642494 RepID=UPI000AD9C45E|nr:MULTISPECIES: hypothetical protein [unclassified Mycobacterium]